MLPWRRCRFGRMVVVHRRRRERERGYGFRRLREGMHDSGDRIHFTVSQLQCRDMIQFDVVE